MDDILLLIRKYAIKNAVEHGSAIDSAVLAKVLSVDPDLKKDVNGVRAKVSEAVKEVNSLDKESLEKAYSEYADEFGKERSEKLARSSSPNFMVSGAVKGAFRTRFAPEPNGYIHIGNAKAAFIGAELAEEYSGTTSLYFDDTNPAKERQDFVEAIKKDLEWLGIRYAEEYYASDNLDYEYGCAEKLIGIGRAYVCFCGTEEMRSKRGTGTSCSHREHNTGANLDISCSLGFLRLRSSNIW